MNNLSKEYLLFSWKWLGANNICLTPSSIIGNWLCWL